MFCVKCGKENKNNVKFCESCGALLPERQVSGRHESGNVPFSDSYNSGISTAKNLAQQPVGYAASSTGQTSTGSIPNFADKTRKNRLIAVVLLVLGCILATQPLLQAHAGADLIKQATTNLQSAPDSLRFLGFRADSGITVLDFLKALSFSFSMTDFFAVSELSNTINAFVKIMENAASYSNSTLSLSSITDALNMMVIFSAVSTIILLAAIVDSLLNIARLVSNKKLSLIPGILFALLALLNFVASILATNALSTALPLPQDLFGSSFSFIEISPTFTLAALLAVSIVSILLIVRTTKNKQLNS